MSSRRLPGKSLRPLCGKPMLQYVLESLAHVGQLAQTIVATSTDASDDPIAEFCGQFGAVCVRGSLDHVAERFLQAAHTQGLSAFVRISGDSPLLDPRLVARGVDLFVESNADVATNVSPRTFPAGMSVEVVRSASFEGAVPKMSDAYDREHVTSYFYGHNDQYQIVNFSLDEPRRDVHLAVDTPEHFDFVARIVAKMKHPHWDYALEDVLRICDELATPAEQAASQVGP